MCACCCMSGRVMTGWAMFPGTIGGTSPVPRWPPSYGPWVYTTPRRANAFPAGIDWCGGPTRSGAPTASYDLRVSHDLRAGANGGCKERGDDSWGGGCHRLLGIRVFVGHTMLFHHPLQLLLLFISVNLLESLHNVALGRPYGHAIRACQTTEVLQHAHAPFTPHTVPHAVLHTIPRAV